MPAIEFSEDFDPESLIQMGLLMRFSGLSTVIAILIIIQVLDLDPMESIFLVIVGIISIPIGFLMGNRMVEEGKRKLKKRMSMTQPDIPQTDGREP